ncbi:alpha/beta hydrolase [Candidatus Babeliales bacterium]|nr:alpha/beta hydrolase [Candidatus Babeliales bacterium]
MKIRIIFCLFLFSFITKTQCVIILVHGTFAADEGWCRPGGQFYDELERQANKINQSLVPFTWTGGLSHENRLQGAEALVKVIQSYPKEEKKILIGHSHGGNVIAIASQLLNPTKGSSELNKIKIPLGNNEEEFPEYIIDRAIFLATPIDMEDYKPNMSIIKYLYNFYSRGDSIQQVFGFYQRLIHDVKRSINFRITMDSSGGFFNEDPTHSEIHRWIVAKSLLDIPKKLYLQNIHGFEKFDFHQNGKIHFDENGIPNYKPDKKSAKEREEKEALRANNFIKTIKDTASGEIKPEKITKALENIISPEIIIPAFSFYR